MTHPCDNCQQRDGYITYFIGNEKCLICAQCAAQQDAHEEYRETADYYQEAMYGE